MAKLDSFRELRVYQELRRLHLVVHEASLAFPKFEMYELGSQVRRSSNAAPAILAEGWGSRHTNIYLEAINRSKGEVRETQHHLDIAHAKGYLDQPRWAELDTAYETCDKMLERLHERLSEWRGTTRTGYEVRAAGGSYLAHARGDEWDMVVNVSEAVMAEFEKRTTGDRDASSSTLHPASPTAVGPPRLRRASPPPLPRPPSTLHPPPSTSDI
jgi:four helix bundle protein